jgi:hypothetical protein
MPDLILVHRKDIPEEVMTAACLELNNTGLSCERKEIGVTGPYSSLEWLIPTAIVLFISEPYLKSFLGEMGKDHYNILKTALAGLGRKLFGKPGTIPEIKLMTAGGKVKKDRCSYTFSIIADSKDGRVIKLMFPEKITEHEVSLATEVFVEFCRCHYAGEKSGDIPKKFNIKGIDEQIIVMVNRKTRGIEFLDPLPAHVRKSLSSKN